VFVFNFTPADRRASAPVSCCLIILLFYYVLGFHGFFLKFLLHFIEGILAFYVFQKKNPQDFF